MAKKLEYSLLNVKLIWVYIKSIKKLKKETQQERFVFEKTIHLGKVFRKLYSMYSKYETKCDSTKSLTLSSFSPLISAMSEG